MGKVLRQFRETRRNKKKTNFTQHSSAIVPNYVKPKGPIPEVRRLLRSGKFIGNLEEITNDSQKSCGMRDPFTSEEAKTIDNGVEVRTSSIPYAGMGLWTQEHGFRVNDFITEYDGVIIPRPKALELKRKGKDTHCRGLGHHLIVDGDFRPKSGRGGASFANDPRSPLNYNAVFIMKETEVGVAREGVATLTRVFLRAIKDIPPYTEIFVNYGKKYWEHWEENHGPNSCTKA